MAATFTDKIVKANRHETMVHAIVERTFEDGSKTYATAWAKRGNPIYPGKFGFSLKQVERTLRVHHEKGGEIVCTAVF